MRKFILTVLALSCVVCASGQSVFKLKKHEFAVGGSFYAGHNFIEDVWFASDTDPSYSSSSPAYETGDITSVYANPSYYNQKISNTWWVSYTYNFTNVFALQFLFAYDAVWQNTYSWWDGSKQSKRVENYYTPMVVARFSRLNRSIVRLYSSVGVGITYLQDNYTSYNYIPSGSQYWTKFALQIAPVGITIGKKLFGYAEIGIGNIYEGGCAGIGYRF